MNLRTARRTTQVGSRALRALAVLALLAFGSTALTACTSVGSRAAADPGPAEMAPTPTSAQRPAAVGDCWQEADYSAVAQWLTWEGSDHIDCARPHNSITFAVPSLAEDFPYPLDRDGALTEPTDEASALVSLTCRSLAQDLLPAGAPEASMVGLMWYLPTVEQWSAGQRQVRCDVSLRSFDTTQDQYVARSLPTTLADLTTALLSDPLTYEACVLTEQGSAVGPFADPSTSQVVRCDGPHTWRWLEGSELPAPAEAPFPGDAALQAAYATICSNGLAADQAWWAFAPDAATWAAGDRSIDCWVSEDQLAL